MTKHRLTIWSVGCGLIAVMLGGCATVPRTRPELPSVEAMQQTGVSNGASPPGHYQGAAYRPVGVTADGRYATPEPAAPPMASSAGSQAVAPAAFDESASSAAPGAARTGFDDWAPTPTGREPGVALSNAYQTQPTVAQTTEAQAAGGGAMVRTQSPDGAGGYAVSTPPQGTASATSGGGGSFVPAGYGVNSSPTSVYQSPIAPPGGVPVQQVFQPAFVPDSPLVQPDQVLDYDFFANETQTGKLMVGVGVNSDAGLVGNIVIDEQNFDIFRPSFAWNDWVNGTAFRGGGERLRIELMPGTEVQRYAVNFMEPYLFNMPVSFGVSGFYFERGYTGYNEERLGGRFSLGYIFPDRPDLSLTGSLGAERVNISNATVPTPPAIQEVLGNNELYTARVQLAHDTRDSSYLPTEGHYIALAFEEGFGTFTFPRFEGDYRQYFVMRQRPDGSGRHIVGLSAKLGVSGSDTPLFENFFAGGFSSIRGFAFRGASPLQDGIPVGGAFEVLTSVEYRFPLTANDVIYGSFFCDAGTVEPTANVSATDFRVTPGFELRINVPALGPIPIAVGLGIPVHHAPGDQIQNFHFFVGISR